MNIDKEERKMKGIDLAVRIYTNNRYNHRRTYLLHI